MADVLPQELSLAMQAVQQLDLAVHVSDIILKVLPGDVYLLAELSEHSCQLPDTHRAGTQRRFNSLE